MQPYRITARAVPRVCKASCPSGAVAATPARNLFTSPFFPAAGFGPAHTMGNDIASVFRLLDNATASLLPQSTAALSGRHPYYHQQQQQQRLFTPRFDVREIGQAYELQGEVPGIEQKDLEIEFVDERTLVIRGKSLREFEEGTRPSQKATLENDSGTDTVKAVAENDAAASDDAASEKSAEYHKASVEDEEYVDAGAETEAKTPISSSSNTAEATAPASNDATVQKVEAEPAFKYWVSERSIGTFERRFAFPGRVDQDAVKASLKNGILSVVVPKVLEKTATRIQIQ